VGNWVVGILMRSVEKCCEVLRMRLIYIKKIDGIIALFYNYNSTMFDYVYDLYELYVSICKGCGESSVAMGINPL
jgi:hypothetical protein